MSRKIVSILALLCFLAISSSAMAVDPGPMDWGRVADWWGTVDSNWSNGGNWGANGDANFYVGTLPPSENDAAVIEAKPPMPIINGDVVIARLMIHQWAWAGAPNASVDVNSGTVNFGDGIYVAAGGGFDSSTSGRGLLMVHGGTVTTNSPSGLLGITLGGQFTNNAGDVNMYGGLLSVPRITVYNGSISLYGGTLECPLPASDANFIFSQVRPGNRIDISGGTLRLAGNLMITDPNLPGLIAGGRIVSTRGNIGVPVFDGTYTTLVASDVNMARTWGPSPDMNATNVHYRVGDVNVGITLRWNDGEVNILNHQVYFGPNSVAVASATPASAEFMGEVNEVNGEPNTFTVSNYAFRTNTQYYWRVDANVAVSNIYDGGGNVIGYNTAIVKGLNWKFQTHNGKAYNPRPQNGQVGLNEPLALTWTAGDFAASTNGHFVYVGTDSASVTSAASTTAKVFRTRQTGTSYSLTNLQTNWFGPLAPGVTYYWKVTEINNTTQWGNGTGGAVVWSFTPAAYITIDDFEDYSSTADVNANWGMNYAVPSCWFDYPGFEDFIGYYSIPATSGTLSFALDSGGKHGSYYYNAVNYSEVRRNYPGGSIFTGNTNVLSVQPAALRVDYIGAAINGVDEVYNRMYVAIEDTAGNVGILDNPDGNAALATSWTQWYSSLKDINAAGYPNVVNLGAVTNFYLGFGMRCLSANPSGLGGDGNVMFDNIRLYAQTCNPSVTIASDLDGDCDADLNDLLVFSTFWLAQAQTINYPGATAPGTPVLWYKFNDSGNTTNVVDYGSTGTYTGTVNRFAAINWNATGGRNGGPCLFIPSIPTAGGGAADSQTYISVPPAAVGFMSDDAHALDNGGGISFTMWTNASMIGDFLIQWPGLWGVWNTANSKEVIECHNPSRLTVGATTAQANFMRQNTGAGYLVQAMTNRPLLDFGGRWNHWGYVKTAHNAFDLGSYRLYCNGELVASADANGELGDPNAGATGPLFPIPPGAIKIGTRGDNWGMWNGKIADFQIYNYALSTEEMQYLATDGTGSRILPLITRANFKSSGNPATEIVDFQDMSFLGDQWHMIQLWP